MSSTLENEDIDNGPLVRMEDVQPARDRSTEVFKNKDMKSEPIETYMVDHLDYDNECVVDDDDSNIGSMVSIQSEEIVDGDDNSDSDLIVPEMESVDTKPRLMKAELIPKTEMKKSPESWPTLEILPGGVIKNSDKCEDNHGSTSPGAETEDDTGGMMYACAKCSQSFKYLFNLVRHVRGHEKERKIEKAPDITKLTSLEKELVKIKRARLEVDKSHKLQKVEVLTRIATAAAKLKDISDFT